MNLDFLSLIILILVIVKERVLFEFDVLIHFKVGKDLGFVEFG